ncbi:ABC transporter permease [Pseudofrankia sp. DC12]|uniref:ABC transporter permease n=1 Tax=Pseudofrankia sp. DC12 TaxID=683315 RepID=UPI000696C731|nr:ABC transporter permease [Pseudofrankia sp. DC12]
MLADNTAPASTAPPAGVTSVDAAAVPPRRRRPSVVRTVAAAWVLLVVGMAVLAPVLPLPGYAQGSLAIARPPSAHHLLGTDQLGRDMLSRVVSGAQTSLLVGVLSVGLALVVGVALGLVAGYYGGKADAVVTAVGDVILSVPGLVFLMVISALAGSSVRTLVIGIALFTFPTFMRLARANTMTFARREFVLAAQGLGARDARVMRREVLPNVLPSVLAYAFAALGLVLVIEGSLSFLGLGVQPPRPSWGNMIADGRPFLSSRPHIVLIPAVTLFLTVLACNALAERGGRPPGAASGAAQGGERSPGARAAQPGGGAGAAD